LLDLDDLNINNFISNQRNNLSLAKRAQLLRLLTETNPQSNSLRKAQATRPHSTPPHAHGTPEFLARHPTDGRQASDPAGAGTALGVPRPTEVGLGRSEAPPAQIPKRAAQLAGPSSEAPEDRRREQRDEETGVPQRRRAAARWIPPARAGGGVEGGGVAAGCEARPVEERDDKEEQA
jgi:hypothetical protein